MTPTVSRERRMTFALLAAFLALTLSLALQAPAPASADTLTAPTLTVAGQTLTWNAIAGVSSYVFVRKVPGQADAYSIVTGTSVTPPAVPGQTVSYSVRMNVSGSAWAREVSIAYPATTSPPPPPASSFVMGVTTGTAFSYELPFVTSLGARTARLLYSIDASAASMAPVIDAYARAGVRPLLAASFPDRLPTTAEAQNLATWATAYGPGGTFWQGMTYPPTPP